MKRRRRRRTVRLRTLLIWLAVVPTVAMAAQTVLTADRLLAKSHHLRADLESGRRMGEPLLELMSALQTERTATAGWWVGAPLAAAEMRDSRRATDRAVADFRRMSAGTQRSPEADRMLREVAGGLDVLAPQRERSDTHVGGPELAIAYYTDVIDRLIRLCQEAFSHADDSGLGQESRAAVALLSAFETVAREGSFLALAGPSGRLTSTEFAGFVEAVGSHRYLYDTAIVPYLPVREREFYDRITASQAWRTKLRIENAVIADHEDVATGVRLPAEVAGWRVAYEQFGPRLADMSANRWRAVLTDADADADALEAEVGWLIGTSGGVLLLVVAVVVLTTRSVLRRLDGLHRRTVTLAEQVLPDVVARLHRGHSIDSVADALPEVRGHRDEVGRINDAFARVVAVSVDGHRQLAAERHGFGMFASGIASRTGNLVSRQLALTEDLQDTFGHDEALLAELMRADQLTVGMRRQIENLLILSGGEIPDPHAEPMRVADLLREAAAEVEDFRRIERQALDEASVEPQAISQISHLLAELLDNATRFSPPRSKVVIRAELVADGLSVEIEDRGPRVGSARYEEMNRRLHTAPPYSVLAENAHRLGLFVVGHLADRLGATVTLRRSVYGGTSAVVILPGALLATAGTPAPAAAAGRPPAAPLPAPVRLPVPAGTAARGPEPVPAPAPEPVPAAPRPSGPQPAAEPLPPTAAGLPARRRTGPPQAAVEPAAVPPQRPAAGRPALPERVPQTHMTEQLRGPRPAEPATGPDTATPEEVADAWADYEHGTQTVEQELRREQP
ncbi:nitrate- and nitrite sensing domain-containing protein [Streptomyces bambusae]|uniref:sensor histidine kinase n=1 Tax=Streptomyces bambusae TaxID=1550616 RepID=UPI001CFC6BF8|nr:sensor histidine kinase [Streptomyces bambusae]MCB5165578.1 nitrate- and nitrite sensing domain-containing protein [Streptomyces bambusae]